MPRQSIDYMNARRDSKAASGGKRYVVARNSADDKAQWRDFDAVDQAALYIEHVFADFNRWAKHTRPGQRVAMLAHGETLDDLEF